MTNKKRKLSNVVMAALTGLSQGGKAHADAPLSFTPLENLAASERGLLENQIQRIEASTVINWDQVIAGVNEKGDLVLIDRTAFDLEAIGAPSCWARPRE